MARNKGKGHAHISYSWIAVLFILSLFISCGGNDEMDPGGVIPPEPSTQSTDLVSFSFLKSMNSSLLNDTSLTIENESVTGRLPYEADIERLVASFSHGGESVNVNGVEQTSNGTFNDFTEILPYKITTDDDRTKTYNVDITYFTGLPIIKIKTNDGVGINSKEDYVEGSVSIKGGRYASSFSETNMKIKGRGNSTWWLHPKKPYQLKFPEKEAFFDMPEDKKWIFLAEYSDKTLLRNRIVFEMGYISNLTWTPASFFAEVFVNDSYNGTYNICQKVEESNNRVALGDTGYLLEIDQFDRMKSDDVFFYTSDFLINIKEPEVTYNSSEYNYAQNHIQEFENALHGSNFKDPEQGYQKYIDVDSFVDWYLINEIVKNQDSRSFSSIFLNFIPGEKIYMGPLWDFDLSFGNVDYSECTNPEGFWVKYHKWYTRLFQDPAFVQKVKTRFDYFKSQQGYILDKIDSQANYLKWSQQENDDKWNLFGNYVWPNPVYFDTHQEEVDHLKNWYNQRMAWLDNAINEL